MFCLILSVQCALCMYLISQCTTLCSAYLTCDEQCCQHLQTREKTSGLEDISGATALSALLIRGQESFPRALYVANCGDTRGVLCEEVFETPGVYEARRLTHDHKATDAEEVARIKELGGRVKNGRCERD